MQGSGQGWKPGGGGSFVVSIGQEQLLGPFHNCPMADSQDGAGGNPVSQCRTQGCPVASLRS